MNILNKKLSLEDFKAYIRGFNFSPLNPTKIVIHHTWRPTVEEWSGEKNILGLKTFYENKKPIGWSAGPHLFIGPDGIWLFSPMNKVGIHAGEGNTKSIGIEVVGDYDNKVWEGVVKENVLGAVSALMEKLNIKEDGIHFHRDYSTKTCPGTAITKPWVINELKNMKKYEPPEWAEAGVKFVTETLVDGVPLMEEIRNEQDSRLSVILERFYKLLKA